MVICLIPVFREFYSSQEQTALNSRNAVLVTPMASQLLTGCAAPINREERALLGLEIQESARGREGPGGPLQSSPFIAYVMKKAKSNPFPLSPVTTSQHREDWAPGEQWLGDIPAMSSDRKPSSPVRIGLE